MRLITSSARGSRLCTESDYGHRTVESKWTRGGQMNSTNVHRAEDLLTPAELRKNFADIHRPLSGAQTLVEASRCLYCYDAPCVSACPTGIDIPKFIHQIRSGNRDGSARTILSANIMGGTCARACPTEVLCEGVCVVNQTEGAPVKIGLLQRHAVDHLMAARASHPFARAAREWLSHSGGWGGTRRAFFRSSRSMSRTPDHYF